MKKQHLMHLMYLAALVAVTGCGALKDPSAGTGMARSAHDYGRVELLRDRWGVPHVFAPTDAGALYGLGYATAQDRAFQMYYNLRILQGRLAELVGDVKVGVTRQAPQGRNSAVHSDIQMRTIGYWQAAQETAAQLDPEARQLLEAYSAGVNDYVRNHAQELLDLFGKYDLRPEPWTPAACIASWWRLGLFFAGDGLREMGPYYEIKNGVRKVRQFAPTDPAANKDRHVRDDASVIQRRDVSDAWVRQVMDYATQHHLTRKVDVPAAERRPGPRFSHAWVVGGKRTTTGSTVLVSDPQTPVRNPSLWYEFHLVGKTFNARGLGVAGSPNILIGFTPQVAWGLTALGADQADLFLLKTDPNRPNQYLLDGRWREMEVRTETLQVKDGKPRTVTFRRTHFGPVVTDIALGVLGGDEAALKRVPLCDPRHDTFRGILDMVRATDVYAFQKALGGWTFPSANCVFGDAKGNIGYKTVLSLPIRSSHSLLDGGAAHEGWDSANDWQGFLPHELLPQVINPPQGWLVSANHRPISSFYPIPMGISTGSLGDTDRSWRLKERVQEKGEAKFTPEDVLAIHYDTVASIKRDLVRFGYHLRDVQKYPLEDETLLALKYVENWQAAGSKLEMSIRGTEILNLMPMAFRQNFAAAVTYGGGLSGLCSMCQTIDARIAANPKATLTDEEADYVNLILRAAWRYGKANFGDDPNQWNERGKKALLETKLPYMSTLDGFESLDPEKDLTFPALRCTDGGTILSQKAQSYTQFVRLDQVDQSMSLLPIGQSEHPDSPYYRSNYDLWAQGQLHPAPLSRKAVEALSAARTVLAP
jgi:penicillin amidase